MRRAWPLILLALGLLLTDQASAHEVRPAYLNLAESQVGRFDVLWKVPMKGNRVLSVQPVLPSGCRTVTSPVHSGVAGAQLSQWTVDCGTAGLDGGTIRIEGLGATMTDVLVRIQFSGGPVLSHILRPNNPAFVVDAGGGSIPVFGYFELGMEHILLGIDHLLFVLALLLIVNGTWLLVKTITAFTVAHSLTLAAATLGWVEVPQAPVEAVIALSIVFVAGEIVHLRQGRAGITARAPWLVAFVFGLLHGFGFAGALSEVGLPQTDIPMALLLFNVGVEVGQLAFVAAVLLLARLYSALSVPEFTWARAVPAYVIGSVAAFWLIQRVALIVGGA